MNLFFYSCLLAISAIALATAVFDVDNGTFMATQRSHVLLKAKTLDDTSDAIVRNNVFEKHHSKFFSDNTPLQDMPSLLKHPFILKIKPHVEINDALKKKIADIGASIVEYIPHHSFLVKANDEHVRKLSTLADVQFVAEYRPEFKLSGELLAPEQLRALMSSFQQTESVSDPARRNAYLQFLKQSNDNSVESDALEDSEQDVIMMALNLMPDSSRTATETIELAKEMQNAFTKHRIPFSAIRPASTQKLIAVLPVKHVAAGAKLAAHHHQVHWIEHYSPVALRENWDVLNVMQSANKELKLKNGVSSKSPYTMAGVTGKDQIIAFGDSGLDVFSCFFHDDQSDVPFVDSNTNSTSVSRHRKIIGYNAFMDKLDDDHGHGTHVAGTLAGKSLYNAPISRYNGHAPDAKIAFFDVGCQNKDGCDCSSYGVNCPCSMFPGKKCPESKSLILPLDLYHGYFAWAYDIGARIHSNSIGGTIQFGYTGTTKEIDRFIADHPDFLVFWSAGNSGRNEGYMTLTGPVKMAKNAVIVGCSSSPLDGWVDVMQNFRNYTERATLMKKGIDQQGFCSCNQTCHAYACRQASKLTTEQGCCSVFDDCKLPHPEQNVNPLANVVLGCCKKCVLNALAAPDAQRLYNEQNLAVFSSLGPTVDGRIKPDLVAPGYYTASAKSHGSDPKQVCTPGNSADLQDSIKELGGTSMATPAAAGNGALVRDYFMQGFYPSGVPSETSKFTPSAALVKAVLISSARPMKGLARNLTPFSSFTPAQRRYFEGFGLVHLSNTLYLPGLPIRSFMTDKHHMSPGGLHTFTVTVPKTENKQDLAVTLVWTDPAASPATSVALVNDLDLTVIEKNTGESFLGNAIDTSIKSRDRVNNVEKVLIPNANHGVYTVQVSAFNIPQGPQQYALVISGANLNIQEIEASTSKTYRRQHHSNAVRTFASVEQVETTTATLDTEAETLSDATTSRFVDDASSLPWYKRDVAMRTWLFAMIVGSQGVVIILAFGIIVGLVVYFKAKMTSSVENEKMQ